MNATSARLGLIGAGTMGAPIARRLIDGGHALCVCDVSSAAVDALVAAGARAAANAREVAQAADIVFLSLPGTREVEAVMTAPDGLLAGARRGQIIVDLSTNAHDVVLRLFAMTHANGVALLDAPLSGGKAAAAKGTLTMMVGGEASALDTVRPILALFASNIFHVGATGMGTIAKLVNNQIFLTTAVAIQEGFVMAAKAGLDSNSLIGILAKASAGTYLGLAPLLLSKQYDNAFFKLGLAAKDMALIMQSAQSLGVALPSTSAANALYREAAAAQGGDKVFFATLETLEQKADTCVTPVRRA
jgi:3-hydroxyisobutyrate dehydrogenase-like beta-hydroxyacid dehydrogenase